MANLGKFNQLKVVKQVNFGVYLDGGELGNILLPKRYVPKNCEIDQMVDVFIYLDSEDVPIATTEKPRAQLDDFTALKCIDVNRSGAFLDWGLSKDLFVPYNEQKPRMEVGKRYIVHVYLDNTDRLAASSRLRRFIPDTAKGYSNGQEVELLIAEKTDLGYKTIIDDKVWGILFFSDVGKEKLSYGRRITGYIKRVRPDGKIDVSLQPQGYVTLKPLAERIIDMLKENNGFMAVSDKSSPDLINKLFSCSKREFKMAIGSLYKARRIELDKQSIRLIK